MGSQNKIRFLKNLDLPKTCLTPKYICPEDLKMDDWGEIELEQIDHIQFWHLFDEMVDDCSGFFHNRNDMLEAYKNGNLYGLRVNETDSMFKRGARKDTVFCANSWYLLPCFCVRMNTTAILMWTHTRARKLGFGKKLVKLLNIEYAYKPLPGSLGFWKKCGIHPSSTPKN